MMLNTRSRLLLANNGVGKWIPNRRVYLTQSRPSTRPPHHARGYRSSLKEPYFAPANPIVVVEQAHHQQQDAFWRQFCSWYSQKLNTHPLLTKALTGGAIAAAGDVLCQAGTYKDGDKRSFWRGWDMRRSFHFFVLGLTFVAPTSHYWYGNLAIHPWTKGQSFVQISKRVFLDQFVWSPVFFVIWLSGFWGMEKNGQITGAELKKDLTLALPDVMVANWILWIPCQYANFYAVPVKYQVLFTNLVELVWNAYLSFATEGGGHGHGGDNIAEAKEVEPAKEHDGEMQFS